MMRILHVPEWYPWPEKPVEGTWVREQVRALARSLDIVVLACAAVPAERLRGRPWRMEDGREDGLRVLRLRYRALPVSQVSFALRLAGMHHALGRLRRSGWWPDVIHASVFSSGLPALPLARIAGAPLIVAEHYTGFPRGTLSAWDRTIARFVFARADVVCPAGADLGRHVAALTPRASLRPMPNLVDTDVFARPAAAAARPPSPPFHAINVASLDDKKGHAYLLDALARVRAGGVDLRLEIVGDGPLRRSLEARANALGLGGAVRFCGPLQREEVAARLAAAHFFVLSSLWENTPNVLVEAMASGLPSVTTNVGGIPEMVDEDAALLVPPADPAALAGALEAMCERHGAFDSALLRRRAEEGWGIDAAGRRWRALYAELAAGRRR